MTITQLEYTVCASFLWEPQPAPKPGPNLCTAIAFAPTYWESPEASKVADGIGKCMRKGWRVTPKNVGRLLEKDYAPWLSHKSFSDRNALPFSVVEHEAYNLVRHYNDKRLIGVVATYYQKMIDKPEAARQLATDLGLNLSNWV